MSYGLLMVMAGVALGLGAAVVFAKWQVAKRPNAAAAMPGGPKRYEMFWRVMAGGQYSIAGPTMLFPDELTPPVFNLPPLLTRLLACMAGVAVFMLIFKIVPWSRDMLRDASQVRHLDGVAG